MKYYLYCDYGSRFIPQSQFSECPDLETAEKEIAELVRAYPKMTYTLIKGLKIMEKTE